MLILSIDKETQLLAHSYGRVLEWIPYYRFYGIKYIAKGGFNTMYRAKQIDGYILIGILIKIKIGDDLGPISLQH